MTESKHTPGPWEEASFELEGLGDLALPQHGLCIIAGDESEELICNLYEHMGSHLEQFTNAKANARLIAAAPELLEALQQMLLWAPSGFAPQSKSEAMSMANDAIAKAIGEAS